MRPLGSRGGFTLIELMVVVAIMSALMLAVLNGGAVATNKARSARAKSDLVSLFKITQAYFVDTNNWPPQEDSNGNIVSNAGWNADWSRPYLPNGIPPDPWGTPYFLDGMPDTECSAGASSICSAGPNRTFESWNDANMATHGDDICIFFAPKC